MKNEAELVPISEPTLIEEQAPIKVKERRAGVVEKNSGELTTSGEMESIMSVPVELLVHHGGLMSFSGRSPRYVNGEVVECSFDPDFLCYFQLRKLGTEDLKYDSVEKIWFVPPGKTLANGLSEVNNDADGLSEYVLFRRIYIGFSCLKKGYLNGCRKLIALDGCFLKGEVKGMILTAVGKDGNNQMFPISWAVVEGENRDSWGWFLSADQQNLNVEQPRARPRRTRRAEADGPSVPAPRRRKVVTCGTCGSSGHNARSCFRNRGVEAVIDPSTNRMQRNNEMRTAMHGVGVYTNPSTGNMYYRGPPTGLNASRSPVVDDYIGGSQPDPPPATQPT
ncbi:hypothetical protein LINPERHAP2_LOCUS14708 [Linum perenne]